MKTLLGVLVLSGCLSALGGSSQAAYPTLAAPVAPITVVAAGDIACPDSFPRTATTCRDDRTAVLAEGLDPDLVLALGDLQYTSGRYAQFVASYDTTWGALRDLTQPVPGNHDYETTDAKGYFRYFPDGGSRVHVAGDWRIYLLDSNCDQIDCAAQLAWFEADLSAHPVACSMIVTHHPRFSSGLHGNNNFLRPIWATAYEHHVDVALAGHDHSYERLLPMSAGGRLRPDRGITSFVVGTGGREHTGFRAAVPGSAYRKTGLFGVLRLSLSADSYTWVFEGVNGTERDAGQASCV